MNYVLTVYLKSGVQEIFLPSVQNRSVSLKLDRRIIAGQIEAALSLDVFDGVWTIRPNADVLLEAPLTLFDGLRINALLAGTREVIVIFVEELELGRTRFEKYHVAPGVPITVGADMSNIIRYN